MGKAWGMLLCGLMLCVLGVGQSKTISLLPEEHDLVMMGLEVVRDGDVFKGYILPVGTHEGKRVFVKVEPFAELVYENAKGEAETLPLNPQSFNRISEKVCEFYGEREIGASKVVFSYTFTMEREKYSLYEEKTEEGLKRRVCVRIPVMWIESQLRVEGKPLKVLRFSAPFLRVEGEEKDKAIFGGLEYLLDGEESSNTLACITEAANRLAPHPYYIAVPVMAIVKDGVMVSLMWDPLQKWDGRNRMPRAVFSSPNKLFGEENHLMGLYVPGIPWSGVNEINADKPYVLRGKRRLTIRCAVAAISPAKGADAVPLWAKIFGLPSPAPMPRSIDDELVLCADAYLKTTWDEENHSF